MTETLLLGAAVVAVILLGWLQIRREGNRRSTRRAVGVTPAADRAREIHRTRRRLALDWETADQTGDRGDSTWLLVTDVDDTLLGHPVAFSEFVREIAAASLIEVVLNSSRPIRSLRGTWRDLPTAWRPLGMIGALGTEIELDGDPIEGWSRAFEGYDRKPIDAVMRRLGFEPHHDEYQTRFKASFAVPQRRQDEAAAAVRETGVPSRIIRSGVSNFDVIPERAGKGAGLRKVAALLEVPESRILAAGDACNDFDMLKTGNAIVVGNATPRLKAALAGSGAHFAERTHAAGVLEGLRSFGAPLRAASNTVGTVSSR